MQSIELISWLESYTGALSGDESEICLQTYSYFRELNTVELDNKAFNHIHDKSKQRLLGITYTPPEIRFELTSTTLNYLERSSTLESCVICDPCCGSGTFSITLAEQLLSRGIDVETVFQDIMHFYDVDRLSLAIALTNLYRHFYVNYGINLSRYRLNCAVRNFFSHSTKFDAFITNPPYVKLQNLDNQTRETLKENYTLLISGASGLSLFFLKKMFDEITNRGIVSVITQNNFFTSNSGKALRAHIQDNLWRIDNFGSEAIFGKVTAYTCLLYLTGERQEVFSYRKFASAVSFDAPVHEIRNSLLDYTKWRLGSASELTNLKILETRGVKLGDACRIWVGIATQLDKAFTVFQEQGSWIGITPSGDKMQIEPDIVQPLLRIADLNSESEIAANQRGVIYPYNLINGKAKALTELELLERFPKALKYLEFWKSELLKRDKGRIEDGDWYKWGRTQSMIPVSGKLLTKTFNSGPNFFFDPSDSLFSNGYALTPKSDKFDIRFIQKLLNSRLFYYYAKLTSFEIQGGYQCYQKNFIERFCIPEISLSEQLRLLHSEKFDESIEDYYGVNIPIT